MNKDNTVAEIPVTQAEIDAAFDMVECFEDSPHGCYEWWPKPAVEELMRAIAYRDSVIDELEKPVGMDAEIADLSICPQCGGEADNGHDRCYPPTAYHCSKCMDIDALQKPVDDADFKEKHTDDCDWNQYQWCDCGADDRNHANLLTALRQRDERIKDFEQIAVNPVRYAGLYKQERDQLKAELETMKRLSKGNVANTAAWLEERRELKATNAALVEGLRKYGEHKRGCAAFARIGEMSIHDERCDCLLESVKAAGISGEGEQ